MMDNFREESVSKRNRFLFELLYMLSWVLLVVFGLIAVVMLQATVLSLNFNILGIAIMVISGAIAAFLFLRKDRLRTEYEYTFTNGELDLAKVFSNSSRKELGSMRIKNVTACGHVEHESFKRYLSMPDVKKNNWFANRDGNLFYFYFVKDSNKRLIIIEPSEELVKLIKMYAQQGAYQG